jgi:hypothetical protein
LEELSVIISVAARRPAELGVKLRPTWHFDPGFRLAPVVQVVFAESITKLLPITMVLPITSCDLLSAEFPTTIIFDGLAVPALRKGKITDLGL